MIEYLSITPPSGEVLTLSLRGSITDPFFIKKIDGLSPPQSDVNMTRLILDDGSSYNSSRVQARNIVLTFAINDIPSVEANRLQLYRFFPRGVPIRIEIKTESRHVFTYAYAEDSVASHFERRSIASVSLLAPSAYFTDVESVVEYYSGRSSGFEFPFFNEPIGSESLFFSSINSDTERTIFYAGEGEIGVTITVHAIGPAGDFSIYNSRNQQSMKIRESVISAMLGSGISAGDDLIIETTKRNKSIILKRNGVSHNVLNALDRDASWLSLVNGENTILYTSSYGIEFLQVKVEHSIFYLGL